MCSALPLFRAFAAPCPGAELTERAIQLPVYSRLRTSDVERVLRIVRKLIGDSPPLSDDSLPLLAETKHLVMGGERQARVN